MPPTQTLFWQSWPVAHWATLVQEVSFKPPLFLLPHANPLVSNTNATAYLKNAISTSRFGVTEQARICGTIDGRHTDAICQTASVVTLHCAGPRDIRTL